jgi:TetR/AcrR family transcriptional regulator, acrAB operon repressor
MDRAILPFEQQWLVASAADAADPLARLRELLCDILRQTATEPRLQRVLAISTQKVEYVGELNGIRERHLRVREQPFDPAQGLAAASGQLAEGLSAGAAARALHSLVDGLIANWMLDRDAFDLRRVGRTAVDQLIAGLQRSDSPVQPRRKTSPKRLGTSLEAAVGQRRSGKALLARPRKVK